VLSAAAGITWWNFYFRLYPGAIHAAEVIDFLGHLLRHLPGKLLVVWDGLPQHRARLVAEFIRAQRGRLAIERLPAYAPELNPVEYIWATGNITSCPTSARAISASSAIRRAAHCAACAGAHAWCARSGSKQICHYDMQVLNSSAGSSGFSPFR
jgi:transposase